MGLFSRKKTVQVASTLYNLAGPEEDRPNYLKGTIFASVLSESPSLGTDIVDSYISGPGIKQRQFFKYAQRNNLAGLPTTSITNSTSLSATVVGNEIPVPVNPAGQSILVQKAELSEGDPEYFLNKWVKENELSRFNENWIGNYDAVLDEFSVQFENGDTFSFSDSEYSEESQYVVAEYISIIEDNSQPINEGTSVEVSALSDLTGYIQSSSTGTVFVTTLVRSADVEEVYSDGTPTNTFTEDASESVSLNRSVDVYERTELVDVSGLQTEGLYERYTYTGDDEIIGGYSDTVVTVEDLGGGETKTTTRTVTGDQVNIKWFEKFDTQQLLESTIINDNQTFIYEVGSGNVVLDGLVADIDASSFQEFYPFLPIRLRNKSLNSTTYTNNGLFEETKKAYRRATGGESINKLLDNVEDNQSIDDIDFSYMMYGVSLNVQENSAKKYLFKFFEKMIPFQNSNNNTIQNFQDEIDTYENEVSELKTWQTNQINSTWGSRSSRSNVPSLGTPDITTIKLETSSNLFNETYTGPFGTRTVKNSYDIRLSWVHIEKSLETGIFQYENSTGQIVSAKKNEVQVVKETSIEWDTFRSIEDLFNNSSEDNKLNVFSIYWQVEDNVYEKVTVYGAQHKNYIYKGKNVKITSSEALDDDDISGFIVPLHYPTMRELSLVDQTQLATANTHIIFNSFEVTKQKWYETALFKIILIIAIIVISVTINPGAFASASGLLGTNIAVGTAIGLSGTAAIVVGAVANYIAAIIVSKLLTNIGNKLLGEEYGSIFSVAVTFALSGGFADIGFNAGTILQLGNVLANGYQGFVQSEIEDINKDLISQQNEFEKANDEINRLLKDLGGNNLNFNPLFLTDSVKGNGSNQSSQGYLPETADEFIRRTTMVGGDVVDITHSMVYDFVNVQQTLPRN